MKAILFTLAMLPGVALAQFDVETGWDAPESTFNEGPYPIIVQPGISVPRGAGPWGTGYSVVTETRERTNPWAAYLGEKDPTTTTTTQRVVPNDALGQPMIGVAPFWNP